jgi:hypothetical protein
VTTSATTCPPWCVGGHGPRFAHTGHAAHVFGVVTQQRMHHGKPTLSIVLDTDRKGGGVTLNLEELDRVIAALTTRRNQLVNANRETQ